MSEEKAQYLETEENETYHFVDEAPHNNFTTIPNMVDDMGLSAHAFRLYCHIRRVAGDEGRCWQSTKTLSQKCNIGMATVSRSKQELEKAHLIRIEKKTKAGGDWYHEIAVIDIWKKNSYLYAKDSTGEGQDSTGEIRPSTGETIKNPVNKNPLLNESEKNSISKAISSANKTVSAVIEQAKNEKWPFREKFPEQYRDLLDAFVEETGIKPVKAQVNDWMATASDWMEAGAKPQDVRQACEEAKPNERGYGGFKVNRPGSLLTTIQRIVGERNKGSGGSDLLSFIRNYKEKNG